MCPIPNQSVSLQHAYRKDDRTLYLNQSPDSRHCEEMNSNPAILIFNDSNTEMVTTNVGCSSGIILQPEIIEKLDKIGLFHEISALGWAPKNQAFFTQQGDLCEKRVVDTTSQNYPVLCVHRAKLEKIISRTAKIRGISPSAIIEREYSKPCYHKDFDTDSTEELRGHIEAEKQKNVAKPCILRYQAIAMFEKVLDGHTIVHAGNHKVMFTCFPLEKPTLSQSQNGTLTQLQLTAFIVEVEGVSKYQPPYIATSENLNRELEQAANGIFLPFLQHKKLIASAKKIECTVIQENECYASLNQRRQLYEYKSMVIKHIFQLDDRFSQLMIDTRLHLRTLLIARQSARDTLMSILQHSDATPPEDALITKVPSAIRLLTTLSPIERVLATANGNMQRLLSSICLAEVFVKPIQTSSRGDHFLDRMVQLLIHSEDGPPVATCITTVVLHSQALREDLMSQKIGIGQILTQLAENGLVPTFNLLCVGKEPSSSGSIGKLTRQYDLTIPNHVSFLIHELVDLDLLLGK